MPMSVRGPSIRVPSIATTPLDAGISPAAIIIRVLLPHPLGPTIEMKSSRPPLSET